MFRKSWNGPSFGELQAQGAPIASDSTPEPKRKRISSIGFWLIGFVLLRALIAGLVTLQSWINAGHTQADTDRDIARWRAANVAYQQSADCGALKGEACRDHWRKEVVPNLKAAEAAWSTFKDQVNFEFAHKSVPGTCRIAYTEFQTAMDRYYPLEDTLVSAVSNNTLTELDDLIAREETANDEVQRLATIDATECKNY
jgi:hypothetical protein